MPFDRCLDAVSVCCDAVPCVAGHNWRVEQQLERAVVRRGAKLDCDVRKLPVVVVDDDVRDAVKGVGEGGLRLLAVPCDRRRVV